MACFIGIRRAGVRVGSSRSIPMAILLGDMGAREGDRRRAGLPGGGL